MKIIKFLLFFSTTIFLSGCLNNSITPPKNAKMEIDKINIPSVITMDNSKFTMLYKNSSTVEYYLPNEKGFHWTRLVSISFGSDVSIEKYEFAKKQVISKNTIYSDKYLNKNDLQSYLIYRPIKNDEIFNRYEVNLQLAREIKCGVVVISYAKNFPPNTDEAVIKKFINDKMPIFLKSIPKINCK